MALITYVTKIHFADEVLEEALNAEIAARSLQRPMVVTDSDLVSCGLVERVLDAIKSPAKPIIHAEPPANPTESACRRAAARFRDHDCDGLIAFGGGSSIDMAKAAGLLVGHEGPLADYAAVEGGIGRVRDRIPPLIAIPTTAGTGSEVGRSTAIVVEDGRKLAIQSPHLVPSVAICDPTLTLDLPPDLTAGTGMDALSHCVETYVATAYNPPADGIALEGLGRAAANIERAVEHGHDLNARREMMAAAMNGALALQKGLGGVHAMSHALGNGENPTLHHGTLNAILLPHVVAFNAPAVGDRYMALKQAMGLKADSDLADGIARLSERLGLPTGLAALGLDRAMIERAAPLAEDDLSNSTNPRRAVTTDYQALMEAAL
ncbi:MAG: iron-containing alcohol dehydrogenase [Pseudomonadota bacterium]